MGNLKNTKLYKI